MTHPLIKQILLVLIQFLSQDLNTENLVASLGPVLDNSNPNRVVRRPGQWHADLVTLTYLDVDYEPHYLGAMEFAFSRSQEMTLADLEQAFGPSQHLPGLRPTAPDNYVFNLSGYELPGTVIVAALPGTVGRSLRVERVTVNRIAPEAPPAEHAQALRIVVFAPLAATSVGSGSHAYWSIWEHSGVEELVGQFMPELQLRLPDHLGFGGKTLDVTLRPASLDDLEPYRILWFSPEAALLLDLRIFLAELLAGEMTLGEVRERVDGKSLPGWAGQALERLNQDQAGVTALIADLDRVLSAQLASILSEERVRALRASWLGLAWLAENLDLSDGSRIQVCPIAKENLLTVFRDAFLTHEVRHPQGVTPAFVIIDGYLGDESLRLDLIEQLAEEAARIGLPLLVGAGDGTRVEPGVWKSLAKHAAAPYVVLAEPRVLLRPGLEVPGFGPEVFDYQPDAAAGMDTSVWANGAWLLGAAIAVAHAHSKLPGEPHPVPLPSLLESHAKSLPPVIEKYSLPSALDISTLFGYDAEQRSFVPTRVRTLGVGKGGDMSLTQRLQSAFVSSTVRRVRYRLPKRTPREEAMAQIREAVEERLPGSTVEVTADTGGVQYPVRVRVTLPSGEVLSHEVAWK
jgi:hypothetical protein